MNPRRSWSTMFMLFCLAMLTGMLAGCSSDSSSSNNESLNIYEIWATNASFTATAGDSTDSKFQLTLSNQFTEDDDILYFTNRGAQQAGKVKLLNLINNIWPRVYGSVAPNALLQGTTATNETVYIACIVDKPVLNKATGQLGLSITYLDGRRPEASLALTDVQLIITNNSAPQPTVWSYNLDGDTGTLEPSSANDGSYTLRIQKPADTTFGLACAPHRGTARMATKTYVSTWNARFAKIPPNVSITYTDSTNESGGGVFTATLSNPVYDEKTGSISFKATNLYSPLGSVGKTAFTMQAPTVFIDNGENFPTDANNVFSIQYLNSATDDITVWFIGDQPPCSKAEALNCDTRKVKVTGGQPADYSVRWANSEVQAAFKRSGTKFYRITNNIPSEITISNSVDLKPGEVLRVVPPIVNGVPEWWYYRAINPGKPETAGTNSWVTLKGVPMQDTPTSGFLFEHNVQGNFNSDNVIVWDLSAVNGAHANATMAFGGLGCGTAQDCKCSSNPNRLVTLNLDAYDGLNDGCPYITKNGSFVSCSNPKMYPYDTISTSIKKPSWVVAAKDFTLGSVSQSYQDAAAKDLLQYVKDYNAPQHYEKLSGFVLADATAGVDPKENTYVGLKSAYHIWWRTNPVAIGWLNYLQHNKNGKGELYGWAYDEEIWHEGDTFNKDGNPVKPNGEVDDNKIYPAITCQSKPESGTSQGKYLNINILSVMK